MATTRVVVLNSTELSMEAGYKLCLQWCRYAYGEGTQDYGYRFIWKTPQGNLMPHRGQARIPSLSTMTTLMKQAIDAGWGNYDAAAVIKTEKERLHAMQN